jgi:hypothetical protein
MNSLEQIMPLTWWAILILGAISLILLIWLVVINSKLSKFKKAYLSLQSFMDGNSLDRLLGDYLSEVEQLRKGLKDSEKRIEKTEAKLRASVDRTELIRFNAFENMGSDLSFALALLNQEGNGVVLSSINSREESRVYAKPLTNGESSYHLSEEEKKAITKARNKDIVKI